MSAGPVAFDAAVETKRIAPADGLASPCDQPAHPRRRRVSRSPLYDDAILWFLWNQHLATRRQLIARFWTYAGRSRASGYEIVGGLESQGLIAAVRLHPQAGRASDEAVWLTRKGCQWLNAHYDLSVQPLRPCDLRWRLHPRRRDLLLQLTELVVEREPEGWVILSVNHDVHALRRRLLQEVGRGDRDQGDRRATLDFDRLRRLRQLDLDDMQRGVSTTATRLPFPVLLARLTDEVRILAPLGSRLQIVRSLVALDALWRMHVPRVEFVCASGEAIAVAREALTRAVEVLSARDRFERGGPRYAFARAVGYALPSFQRTDRTRATVEREDRYAMVGAPDPRTLVPPAGLPLVCNLGD
ncbi:MAG: hypothetical protein M3081_04560, partial [Gemmatimonadota bacterium]|nr:hypothetical protein [Gemmatimonadota bacterium]